MSDTNTTGTVTERAHAAMVNARNSFQRHIENLNAQRHLFTNDGYKAEVAAFKNTYAAQTVLDSVNDLRTRRDKAQADVDKVRASLSSPGDAAQESRNDRYWNRTKPILDSLQGSQALAEAQKMLAKANREEMSVLLTEIPAYLRLRLGALDANTKLKNDLPESADWGDLIDKIYLPVVVPEYGEAKQTLAKANAAVQLIESGARALQRGFDSGSVPSAQMIDMLNPSTAGRLPTDRRGTLPDSNGGKYDPDL